MGRPYNGIENSHGFGEILAENFTNLRALGDGPNIFALIALNLAGRRVVMLGNIRIALEFQCIRILELRVCLVDHHNTRCCICGCIL